MAGILSAAMLMAGVTGWQRASARDGTQEAVYAAAISEKKLVPVGRTVGLKLFSHGVMVVGLDEGASPAKNCGLKTGDLITAISETPVNTIEEVENVLENAKNGNLSLTIQRGGRQMSLTAELDGEKPQLGAWVRDSMAGIGTVTWYDPETGQFCALGHGINDVDTGLLMPLKGGGIMSSKVTGIVKGSRGTPGQLHGSFDLTGDIGTLTENTAGGVFGQVFDDRFDGAAVPLASRKEVHTGKAVILSNIDGETVQEYSVEILRIYPENGSDTRNLMIQVTDERLLSATGGIVQGQSGSPILQDGRLVGAVTHVLVNDPTRGYGILMENMMVR